MPHESVPPTERVCERCGRHDAWDPDAGEWRVAGPAGERRFGDPTCAHEWTLRGDYNPYGE
jgi:hypothetical protein